MSDAWKARLLPASFRGIPFFVDDHEVVGGRHAVSHEFPDREKNYAEDIGRKGSTFRINGHVLGDGYFFLRNGLIDAMEQKDSGILIHPYLGLNEVQPQGYTFRESTTEGRIAYFTLEFIEAGTASFPVSKINEITKFVTNTVVAVAQIQNAFQLAFSLAMLPGFARDTAVAIVEDFATTIRNGFKNVRLDPVQHSFLAKKTTDLIAAAASLVLNPASLIGEVDSVIDGLKTLVPPAPTNFTIDTSSGRDDQLDVFRNLLTYRGNADTVPRTTPTRIAEGANLDAFSDAVQQLAIVRLSEQVIAKDFKSNDEALEIRTEISDNIQAQLLKARTSDDVAQALSNINGSLVKAVPNTESDLYNIRALSLVQSVPSLVLAYDLYEAPENERDLIDRNKIRNPGFINGQIEVLSVG